MKKKVNSPASKYKRYAYVLLFTPLVSLLALTLIPSILGCSEYIDQISATCESLGNRFGVNVSDELMLPVLIAGFATLLSVPIGLGLVIAKQSANSHRESRDKGDKVRE